MNWRIVSGGESIEIPAVSGEPLQIYPPVPEPDPIDCVVSPWGDWSDWSAWVADAAGENETRTRTRTRSIVISPEFGGASCPVLSETEPETRQIPPPPPTTKPLVMLSDLTLLGFYDVQTNGNNTSFAQGLALRRVNGDLRLLMFQHGSGVHEVSLKDVPYGATIKAITGKWDISRMNWVGLDYDDRHDMLTSVTCRDYEAQVIPTQLMLWKLGTGTVTAHGPVSLEGISAKRVYGGLMRAPSWWTDRYPHLTHWCGFGGYTSLVRSGGTASMGPTLYAIPDPMTVPAGTQISAKDFLTLMDHSSGTLAGSDWYAAGRPEKFDRGQRLPNVTNYYDGGDPRPNPTTRPTNPPQAGARWLSPSPDGFGRCVWGDTFWNTGMWIETPNRRGFALLQSVSQGSAWYGNATLNADSLGTELHVFDPATILASAEGKIAPWLVRPTSIEPITFPGLDVNVGVNITRGKAAAAKFDAETGRLYVAGFSVRTYFTRIYVFQVA